MQGAQTQCFMTWWGERWEGSLRGRARVYPYGWFMLMYGKQLKLHCKAIFFQLKMNKSLKIYLWKTKNSVVFWEGSVQGRKRVWVNSGSWWWTGRPGVLRFMGLQTVGYDWATELNWKSLQMVTAATLTAWKKSYDQPRQHIKKQRYYFTIKGPSSQSYGFSSSHVWVWELDYKESWVQKNWLFWTVVLEKTLESPLDCREIQPVHPKGN